jgi:hypothetical protein
MTADGRIRGYETRAYQDGTVVGSYRRHRHVVAAGFMPAVRCGMRRHSFGGDVWIAKMRGCETRAYQDGTVVGFTGGAGIR